MACRKDYRDLTPTEKDRFVQALHHVKANGVVGRFASDHAAHFNHGIHRTSHFLPWHREFIRRFEAELRAYHPAVSLPYWNSTVDTSTTSALWAHDFLGQFDSAWGLGRALGSDTLPAPGDVDTALGIGAYDAFWPNLETVVHNPPHRWVGGEMAGAASPNDPVFFLHHCWIDMIWAQWQLRHPGAAFVADRADTELNDPLMGWSTTPADVLDHRTISSYDYLAGWTPDSPRVTLVPGTEPVRFLDVPQGSTRMAAVVVELDACDPLTFVVEDPAPAPPFGKVAGTVVVDPSIDSRGRLWLTYLAATPGVTHTGTVRVHCAEAAFDETVDLYGESIARPTAAVAMVLDRSNSMNFDSGIGPGISRADVLRFSAPPAVDVTEDGHAVSVSHFDHDAHPGIGLTPVAGIGRTQVNAAIGDYAPNPDGWTSIGEGIAFAHGLLQGATETVRAMVVLTDGQENHGPHNRRTIDQVAPTVVGDRVFAIGLGQGDAIRPEKLAQLCNGTHGYMLLTGALDGSALFRLAKYYQQIFAGVTSNEVVLDPDGILGIGQEHRIPFQLTESDIDAKAVLLTPAPGTIEFEVESPAGEVVDAGTAGAHPMLDFSTGSAVALYRIGLPLPLGGPDDAHAGTWHAVLRRREKQHSRTHLERSATTGVVPYSLLVQAYSNLRMRVAVTQSGWSPGAVVTLRAVLTEFGVPIQRGAACVAHVTRPDGTPGVVVLTEAADGEFEGSFVAAYDGVYQLRVVAAGRTRRGRAFTREQLRTAAVWLGGGSGQPDPNGGSGHEELCELVGCLLEQDGIRRLLERHEVDPGELRKCLEHWCHPDGAGGDGGPPAREGKGLLRDDALTRSLARHLSRR
jgi:hypothetical protein